MIRSNACSHLVRTDAPPNALPARQLDGGDTVSSMAPNPLDMAAQGVRTLQAFGRRIPEVGGLLAPSLEERVAGKTVLITGASSGIGRATALKIGEAGSTMLLVARTKEKLDELAGEIEDLG